MKYLYAILILDILLLGWAFGDTNSTQAISPPLPVSTMSGGGIRLPVAVDSNALYQASLRPTPRVLMSDGLITNFTASVLEWYVEPPYFRVVWKRSLTNEWKTIGTRIGGKYSGDLMVDDQGFYDVIPSKRPTLPPTYPPKRFPTNSVAMTGTRTWVVNTNSFHGGFTK